MEVWVRSGRFLKVQVRSNQIMPGRIEFPKINFFFLYAKYLPKATEIRRRFRSDLNKSHQVKSITKLTI